VLRGKGNNWSRKVLKICRASASLVDPRDRSQGIEQGRFSSKVWSRRGHRCVRRRNGTVVPCRPRMTLRRNDVDEGAERNARWQEGKRVAADDMTRTSRTSMMKGIESAEGRAVPTTNPLANDPMIETRNKEVLKIDPHVTEGVRTERLRRPEKTLQHRSVERVKGHYHPKLRRSSPTRTQGRS
jgi:hypothetical protein